MKVVELTQYNLNPEKALELKDYPVPEPNKDEVVVEVYAASINPIDTRIRQGYGQAIFSSRATLPIVLGRDFSGVVSKVGEGVAQYKPGDEVFGVVSPFRANGLKQGSHAEFVCVPINEIVKKPANITHLEAASLPYVALTTYYALITQTGMQFADYANKRVFIHAGAGGVGSYAIQFLKALGAHVTTTCSTKNVGYVQSLGADEVINYTQEKYESSGNFDVAYDLLGKAHTDPTLSLLKSRAPSSLVIKQIDNLLTDCLNELSKAEPGWSVPKFKSILQRFDTEFNKILPDTSKYISIVGPMMPLTDAKGLYEGMREYIHETLIKKTLQAKEHGRLFNYAVFEPNDDALILLAEHVANKKILPQVSQVFPLDEASKAHKAMESGHTQGKIVLRMR